MDRSTKEKVVVDMNAKLQLTKLAALAEYRGLTVEKMSVLRTALRPSQTQLKVVKNTLLRLAARGTPAGVLEPHMKGPLAIAINYGDAVEATKVLVEFAKKNPEFDIKVASLEGKLIGKADMQRLSDLPGRDVLLANLLAAMAGVPRAFVGVLSAVPRSLVQVLVAYGDKKSEIEQ